MNELDNTVTLADAIVTPSTLVNVSYGFTKGPGIPGIPGRYTILNGVGSINLTTGTVFYSFGPGTGSPVSAPVGQVYTASQAGIVNFDGGTGIFAGLTGAGTVSFNAAADANTPDVGQTTTNFDATFEAVPEPAPVAILGVGAVGFLVRRRRK